MPSRNAKPPVRRPKVCDPPDESVAVLIERYQGASGMDEVHAPLVALECSSRCAAGSIWRKDKPTYQMAHQMAVDGIGDVAICEFLQSRGFHITQGMWSRHMSNHIKPLLLKIAMEVTALVQLAKTAFSIPSGDLALMTVQSLMVPLVDGLKAIDTKRYQKMAREDPMGYATFCLTHAKALTAVHRSITQAEIMDAKLDLDKLRVKQGYDKMFQTALQEMVAKLSATDEGKAMLPALQRLLTTPSV